MEDTVPLDEFLNLEILDTCWAKMNTQLTPREREEMNKWRMKLYMYIDSIKILNDRFKLEGNFYDMNCKLINYLKKDIGDIPMMTE